MADTRLATSGFPAPDALPGSRLPGPRMPAWIPAPLSRLGGNPLAVRAAGPAIAAAAVAIALLGWLILGDPGRTPLFRQLPDADKAAIVILSYRPFFLKKELAGYLATVSGAERFHALFAKHRVRAVISAAGEIVSRTDRDGIAYINAGCAPMYRRDVYDRFRYHVIDISNDAVTVTGRKL